MSEEEKSSTERVEDEAEASLPPQKDIISYDDFARLDIRIGTITAVEVVEGADKLLKLTVDLGEEEPRQIVSGIREFFKDPQFLVGKQCPFVANLASRVIRGLESQGMILAASTDLPAAESAAQVGGTFGLLIPHNELPSGTTVV